MDTDSSFIIQIVVVVLFLVINVVLHLAETAIISMNDKKLKNMAAAGDRKAKRLEKLLSKPTRFFTAMHTGVNVSALFAAAVLMMAICERLHQKQMNTALSLWIAVVAVTLLLSYLITVFGEWLGKRIGENNSESAAMALATPALVFVAILTPFIGLVELSGRGLVRLFNVESDGNNEKAAEEEIRLMVDAGEEKGFIPENEKMMINNIFEFDDMEIDRVMTHRTDVVAVPHDISFQELVSIAAKERYTRLPVYEETLDNIIGILHIKSLLTFMEEESHENFDIDKLLIAPYFVPQYKTADALFKEMQTNRLHMAVVVDEYGGTAGVVTMEDLLEFIVGNIQDEYDDEEMEIQKISESEYIVEGTADFQTVMELLEVELDEDEEEDWDYDTIGGFVMGYLDKIPALGDQFQFKNVQFEVMDIDDKRALKIRLTILPPETEQE